MEIKQKVTDLVGDDPGDVLGDPDGALLLTAPSRIDTRAASAANPASRARGRAGRRPPAPGPRGPGVPGGFPLCLSLLMHIL